MNPEKLTYLYEPVKLQPIAQPIVETPAQLAAIADELAFDGTGRVVQDANYIKARQYYANAEAAMAGGAVRIYVPGYGDAMGNVSGVLNIAKAMKKYNVKPVYDMWFCGTAGEEGKGNLAGMKQLYGYDQNLGTGTNPLNFVTNFGIDGGSGTINFIGSYRFEMKYTAPTAPGPNTPNAVEAAAASIAKIADIKTPWDTDKTALKTTYTVGVASCEDPVAGSNVVPSCTIQVDMRSPRIAPLNEIRARIEPLFQAGVTEENARFSVADNSAQAVQLQLTWFGDRPPHERTDLSDVSIQAAWQSAETVGVDQLKEVSTAASSLNDNVPAAIGVPTINLNIGTSATGGGGHAFWEWGIPGESAKEVLRMQRVMSAALIASGFTAADGTVVAPAAPAIGKRTAEVK
ncbi:peptidase M20 [Pseudorhodoferax sp. Leaf267]|nr:peptidase M20 [Pseudorhodoferax sp. Leaf267]